MYFLDEMTRGGVRSPVFVDGLGRSASAPRRHEKERAPLRELLAKRIASFSHIRHNEGVILFDVFRQQREGHWEAEVPQDY